MFLVFRVWPVAGLGLEFRLHRIRRVAARLRVRIAIALVVVRPLQVLEKISVRTVRPFVFGAIRPAKFVGYCAARHGDRRKHQRRARSQPATRPHEALDRAGHHEQIGLTIGRMVRDDFFRRHRDPFAV